jgi:RNA polymerase sigma-70 factor (ECF subfamily)
LAKHRNILIALKSLAAAAKCLLATREANNNQSSFRQNRCARVSYARTYRSWQVQLERERLGRETVKSLYEKHGATLAAYACSRGLDFASAEDIVQQVFLKLLGGHTVRSEALTAYLYRAVRNACVNLRRDRRHEVELQEEELWFSNDKADRVEICSLQRAIRDLPEEQRETVFLKIWSGLTLQEIADATEIPLNTVASRYRYALEKLRERLITTSILKD